MSGPNTSYDPVEVAVLQPAEIARMRFVPTVARVANLDEERRKRESGHP